MVEQPDCICWHIRENTKHFLLDCLLYGNEWNQMITELNRLGFEPLLKHPALWKYAMFFGKPNQKEFVIIQQFIKDTKMFS